MKKILNVSIALFLIAVLAITTLFLDILQYAKTPLVLDQGEKEVLIAPNRNLDGVLSVLSGAGLKISPFKLKWIARAKGYDKKIKAGEYALHSGMTPLDILEILVSGKEKLHRLTIPEGYTLVQIAEALEDGGWSVKGSFLSLTENSDFIKNQNLDVPTLEGYLFPDTYYFPRKIATEKIIGYMLDHFRAVFTEAWEKRAEELGFTVHDVVTLASIIEKETGAAFERPLIASVFHNRLKKGMRLESDPTVIYGIEDYDGNITKKHLVTRTPYNTYKIKGLPPGPIANPGKKALEAALYPDKTNFLFFVSKKDNTHYFSTNYDEHVRAVRKYQLNKK